MLTLTYLSEVWNERSFMGMLAQIWILPNIIALAVIPSNTSPWARYAIVIILLSYPYRMHKPPLLRFYTR